MKIFHLGNEESNNVLLQMVAIHDLELVEEEVQLIQELSGTTDFHLIAVSVDNWNNDLSPWEAPAAFGNVPFGGAASSTLQTVLQDVIAPLNTPSPLNLSSHLENSSPKEKKIYIGGYSLAGLFALWSVYQTDIFAGCAAVSPSVWYPGFTDYITERQIQTDAVYLSLGDKEEKTRNPQMSQVGNAIRAIHAHLTTANQSATNGNAYQGPTIDLKLEWNQGNHFSEPDLRTAKGFAWLLTHK